MSVREFAAHLGVNDAAVSNWERRGVEAKLRYDTQRALDTVLAQSSPQVVQRFGLILRSETTDAPPADTRQAEMSPGDGAHLGDRSGRRSSALLATTGANVFEATYQPDRVAVERFRQFLDSTARVFVLAGAAGSGKTRLTQHLARESSEHVDYQFHACSRSSPALTSLATEILRYASLPSGLDPLLSLECESSSIERPCVVVLDGVDSEEQLTVVGRQVDSILRQASSNHLRFILVARTPPELDLSFFPVLAAATFGQMTAASVASYTMMPWPLAQARELWDRDRRDDQIPFADLPESLQSLAQTPLYMQILRNANGAIDANTPIGTVNAFRLVDHCVRTVLSASATQVEATMDHLAQLACELMPDAIPGPLVGTVCGSDHSSRVATTPIVPFAEQGPDGRIRFTHDVFREYFLALRIVEQMIARGRSAATVAAFNELAAAAARSAAARGVLDFVVCALDSAAPNLIEVLALAPSIALDTALPMLLETAATHGALAPAEIVRACAHRCTQAPTRQLTQALLATPHLAQALGDQHATWAVEQLRIYGSEMWEDLARHVEDALDIRLSTRIIENIDLDRAEEAAFLARHIDLFTNADLLDGLLHHLDWRVRAGLAEALLAGRLLNPAQINRIVDHLMHDDDYKVRAAIARTVGKIDTATIQDHLPALLQILKGQG